MFLKNYTSILQRQLRPFQRHMNSVNYICNESLGFLCDNYLKMCPHYLAWLKNKWLMVFRKDTTFFHLTDLKLNYNGLSDAENSYRMVNSLHLKNKIVYKMLRNTLGWGFVKNIFCLLMENKIHYFFFKHLSGPES